MHKAPWVRSPMLHKPGTSRLTCDLSPWEVEAGVSESQGHLWVQVNSRSAWDALGSHLWKGRREGVNTVSEALVQP